MDISRLKKVLAGASVAAMTLTGITGAFAAYSDVSSGVWYEEAVNALLSDGILDASQPRFRGAELANRAEFTKLIVEMNGGVLSTPPAVASFSDVATSAWYYSYMEEAGKEGWVKGDGNCYGTKPCYARPGANINRAEAAALIVRAFALEGSGDAARFVDNPAGQWYTESIQTAADYCVLQGDDSTGRVRPADNMNRAEMVVMLYRVDQGMTYGVDCGNGGEPLEAGLADVRATALNKVDVEYNTSVDRATAEDISNYTVTGATPAVTVTSAKLVGDDLVELMLSGNLTSGNSYTLTVDGVDSTEGDMISDSMSFNGYSTLPTSNGTLKVGMASGNPIGDTVPRGAVGVTMLTVDLTASCDDSVQIEDLTVLHEGFGAASDLSGVYAAVDGARLSRKRTIDSKDQTARVHFSQPLTIAACKTVTVDLMADFTAAAAISAEHNLAVELPSDVQTNAKQVTGSFPLRGSTFKVAAVTSGLVTVEYRTVTPNEANVGEKGIVLGRFQVSTDSVEDQTLYSLTINNNGSAGDGDLTNLKIRRTDGTVITNTVATLVGDFGTFVFDPPFTVLEGDRITLEIIGDVEGGAGDTVKLRLEETSDLFAVGSLYGYGVNGQLYGSRVAISTATDVATVTIDAGEFTMEINGPAQQSYTRDQNDAVLANIIFTTGGDAIDVRSIYMAIQATTSTGTGTVTPVASQLENVTLRNSATGRSVDGVNLGTSHAGNRGGGPFGIGTFQVYRFDDFTVTGKEDFELRVDFIDNGTGNHPSDGDQFRVLICGEPTVVSTGTNTAGCAFGGFLLTNTETQAKGYQMEVEGLSTGDNVNDVRPRGVITGNAQRIADATLTVTVKGIGTTDTAVRNSKNVNLLRFEAQAGAGKDILLTQATFTAGDTAAGVSAGGSGALANGNNYALWADTDGDGIVDTIAQQGVTSQGGKITFNNLSGGGFVIPKEKTVVMEVHSNIAGSLTNDDLRLAFSSGDSDYVQAEQVDRGSSLAGIKTNGGACSNNASSCDIIVTTTTSVLYSLVNQGNLYVSQDTTPLRNRQLLAGTLGDSVLRLNLRAENEDVDVTDIQLNSSGSTAGSVDRLELYKEGATSPFAVATGCGSDDALTVNPGNGQAVISAFCAKMQSRQLVVPKGTDVKVLVKPRLKSDVDGALSNQKIQFWVNSQAISNPARGSGAVRARGDQSSNPLDANGGDSVANGEIFIGMTSPTANSGVNSAIIGNLNVSALSKIATITNANPDANGSNVPTGISDVGQFKFAAATNTNSKNGFNKVVLSGVVFNVNATNVAFSRTAGSFLFFNKANASVTSTCLLRSSTGAILEGAEATVTGAFTLLCDSLVASSVNTTIDQGSDQTFVIQGNITNNDVTPANTSQLQVSLQQFDSMGRTTFGAGNSTTTSHLQWVDQDSGTFALDGTTTHSQFNWIEYAETNVKSTSYQS